jgi:RNA 3'-terminal phosphate cyclase (ATP)
LQVSLPCLLFNQSDSASNIEPSSTLILRGGTNASNAPQIDYTERIFIPFLKQHFNLNPRLKVVKRGYYPKGGGLVTVSVPMLPLGSSLPPITLVDRGALKHIHGKSYVAGSLPILLAQKMSKAATRKLSNVLALDTKHISIESVQEKPETVGAGSGSGIVVWAETEGGCILGGSALGSKGKDATAVGEEAAEELIRSINAGGCVDEYMQVRYFPICSRLLMYHCLGPNDHIFGSCARDIDREDWHAVNIAY